VAVFVWNLTFDLSGLGDPASSYATAVLALGVFRTLKPDLHDKVETPLVGGSRLAGQEIQLLLWNQIFIAVFERVRHRSLL
jgi:hypothetical protein